MKQKMKRMVFFNYNKGFHMRCGSCKEAFSQNDRVYGYATGFYDAQHVTIDTDAYLNSRCEPCERERTGKED